MRILKFVLIILILVPQLALAQTTPGQSGRRVIVDKEELQTPVEATEERVNKASLYSLGVVVLIIIAVLAGRSLVKQRSK